MQITAFYRTFDGDNTKPRPPYYSKRLAFESFLQSWCRVPASSRRLVIAVDSPRLPRSVESLVESHADEVRYLGQRGNSLAYRAVLAASTELDDDGLVYHAEDDYLYHPDAFPELLAAAARLPRAHYFTLYDHRDRYTRSDDAHLGRREFIALGGNRHWRACESTCMTFAARTRTLKRDAFLHRLMTGNKFPHDRLLWRIAQGIGMFWWKVPKRVLISPMPSLATHLDPEFIAPVVDWAEVAAGVARASAGEGVERVEHFGG
ncbi:MAG TPA: hypothetical protein VK733_13050 [Gemmatimonadaceae bacterium]|jgi:hypothetical protein|nr:hypothetical protein [Gemmatimonadaceae bacterium]